MKLCKDCKHYDRERKHSNSYYLGGYIYHVDLCRRGQTYVIHEFVNGSGFYEGEEKLCHDEREDALRLEEFRCGKDGKFWEAK